MVLEISEIWKNFQEELRGFINRKVKNIDDANDILQEVFIKISRNLDKVNKAENMQNYLFGIVRNNVNDYFRKKRFDNPIDEFPDSFSEEENTSLNQTIADCCIKPFIDKLPEKYRQALIITEFENISQKELASRLGISYSGAKSRVQRGKEKLKELVLNCCSIQTDKYGNVLETGSKNCGCP